MTMVSLSERRRAPRRVLETPCRVMVMGRLAEKEMFEGDPTIDRIVLPDTFANELQEGQVIDVSETGARLWAPRIPVLLSRVEIEFDFPGLGPTTVIGLVMWRSKITVPLRLPDGRLVKPGFGILFEVASLELRRAIVEFVDARHS